MFETARLVTLSPWLDGHAERITFLVQSQRADGGWGPPDGYALVPTLSATEALLATLHPTGSGAQRYGGTADLATAADRGLQALTSWLRRDLLVPDTPAADLIVPSLVAAINQHLERVPHPQTARPDGGQGFRLGLPAGMDETRLAKVRHALATGVALPPKLLHFLEVLGPTARPAAGIHPVPPGAVGASPAATAAWIGDPDTLAPTDPARTFLATVAAGHGGPVPCPLPITVFERAWVISGLRRAGVQFAVPPSLVASLRGALGPVGSPTGPGLPADADTTSVLLYALGRLGQHVDPRSLWTYETADGFCTWPGEDGFSISTNAHVLDAFGQYVRSGVDPAPRYVAAIDRLTATLREHQQVDGEWRDRWHASPYYATACSTLALDDFGSEPAAESVTKAVHWILATQRDDGSWGRWGGTPEETAYAMQVLLATRTGVAGVGPAAKRGYAYLREAATQTIGPALWYGKELYRPTAIVRAAVLAAMHLARQHPELTAPAGGPAPATAATVQPKPRQTNEKPVIRAA
ncbi:prenyltransferase/squalene oxidase repeat-containing protein [Plantactinospora sp. KLBMP9567]|uniref:prenyltransferase/squalene oxidase repeat-containing protein n=1 Tax=Plantactinospora sp. KLBMP9567 TaxID=3085900 RepID=UPI002980DFD0|nr:prenyltransferase/squalene oxidase repeat-containing protein [Plantactinospora sp. KLBMP9567]MDW5330536.1 prenyltransferase/squalene oxidase repeat-containing protein [Plantactinospora sp. KLBMP9567]